jgi:hypothetical protein
MVQILVVVVVVLEQWAQRLLDLMVEMVEMD